MASAEMPQHKDISDDAEATSIQAPPQKGVSDPASNQARKLLRGEATGRQVNTSNTAETLRAVGLQPVSQKLPTTPQQGEHSGTSQDSSFSRNWPLNTQSREESMQGKS